MIATVQQAMTQAPAVPRRHGGDNTSELPVALQRLSWLFAFYLCFTSLRIQEIIPVFAIPKLPMTISLVLAGVLVIATPKTTWQYLWTRTPVLRLQLGLVALAIATIPTGIWMGNSWKWLWPGYFLSTTVFCVGLVVFRDRRMLFRVLGFLTAVLATLTTLVLAGVAASTVGREGRLMVGASLDPNDFAWILATFIPIAILLGLRSRRLAPFWFSTVVVFLAGIVSTQSRGGFLAVIAAASVLLAYGASGWRRVVLITALGAVGLALIAYINATGASRLTDFSGYSGGTGRTELWTQGLKWMVQRPWGYGMGNYGTYNVWVTGRDLAAHSAYINIGVELGITGLALYVGVWVSGIRGLTKLRRQSSVTAPTSAHVREKQLSSYLLASVAANAVGSAFLNTQYIALTLFLQALIVAVAISSSSTESRLSAAGPNGALTTPTIPRQRMRRSVA